MLLKNYTLTYTLGIPLSAVMTLKLSMYTSTAPLQIQDIMPSTT
jgi:hypothetical protein